MSKNFIKQPVLESLGKTFIDIGKLAVGSLVFGSVIKNNVDTIKLMVYGGIGASIFIILGTWLSTRKE